ncbi:hypothetical protein FVEG_15928 [Fusarium verticillioides 7600]|uniref:Uncharacterized protein n=1 Tax=Gibberella moniliformis (strain M3125 / FGSC 7600) TaxID=334819 RepID=W7MEV8_GIBM7|nr:hypothetical protein FVEG_15928 [Fusarium verticillioides 7600]EWG46140.1 hypothetical protein FVEG_15928 [Fusarium verticillioides 7600]RBR14608.1 hypothetical protein FVER53590_29084 [Fusarium verticillioides]
MDIDPNSPGSGPGSRSQADFPFDSLVDTFPFLTDQAHRALNIQLDFFRNLSTMDLPIPQDANAKEKLKVILAKAELVNEIVKSLTESSELLMQLKNIEYDEVIAVRKAEVSSTITETSVNIKRVIAMQTEEVRIGLGQQGAAEVQEQQRLVEQEMFMQQRNVGLMGASESPESRIPYVQPQVHQQSHAPQQNNIADHIPGLRHASVPPAGPQGYNPVPLNNPGPVQSQAPAHPQPPVLGPAPGYAHLPTLNQAPTYPHNPVHAQFPVHPLPQQVPLQRQDSVYAESSTTSSDDSEIRMMLARELKKQKKKDRAAKRMAKMKRERERGDFCKRCGRC